MKRRLTSMSTGNNKKNTQLLHADTYRGIHWQAQSHLKANILRYNTIVYQNNHPCEDYADSDGLLKSALMKSVHISNVCHTEAG